MKTFTKEEKAAYFVELRTKWQAAKELSKTDRGLAVQSEMKRLGLTISPIGYFFIKIDMEAQGLEGYPVVDAKTFDGWKQTGFKVKKGEHSKLHGITWVTPENKETKEKEDFAYPKSYNLFHRSQVEAI